MNNNRTELVFILDRSSSMRGLEASTISGYNELLAKQKHSTYNLTVSTVLFDDEITTLHHRLPVREVKDLTPDTYYVRGMTALYDAVGLTIDRIGEALNDLRTEKRPQRILVVIITDGEENASREYSGEQVREMIKHQREKYAWEFIFLGANIEVERYAKTMGINVSYARSYAHTKTATKANYDVLDEVISEYIEEGTVNETKLKKIND